MHIADGILSPEICVAAGAVTLGATWVTSRRAEGAEIPRMGLMAAALFTSSLIHVPVMGTTVHLGLHGLAGVILGVRAFPVVFASLLLQSVIFQHGGLLSLGVNALNMGLGALAAAALWRLPRLSESLRAFVAGFVGVGVPATLMVLQLRASGFESGIFALLGVYALVGLGEGAITAAIVRFFRRVRADILGPSS